MSRKEARRQRLQDERRQIEEQAQRETETFFLEGEPVKQYVRHYGWLQVMQDYVRRRQQDGVDRPLTYLTLPGPSATDIGLLHRAGLLAKEAGRFPDVVICDEKNAEKALEVLGGVRGVSSQAFEVAVAGELASYFPIDVVNLDLSGAVVTGCHDYTVALRRLVGIQRVFCLQRGQSFLLLLTTSTDDRPARRYLEGVLSENLSDEGGFQEAYAGRYGVLDPSPFQEDYRAFVGLVLPKVIARMARERRYRVIEHFAGKYDRRSGHRMLCHSFELEPLGGREPSKKYEPRFPEIAWEELEKALSKRGQQLAASAYEEFLPTLVRRDLQDISEILRSDPELEAQMREEAASLIGWNNPTAQT